MPEASLVMLILVVVAALLFDYICDIDEGVRLV
jgi:hypothetical protein